MVSRPRREGVLSRAAVLVVVGLGLISGVIPACRLPSRATAYVRPCGHGLRPLRIPGYGSRRATNQGRVEPPHAPKGGWPEDVERRLGELPGFIASAHSGGSTPAA
jgi:hypothetical protein